jgi:hypothetical protein
VNAAELRDRLRALDKDPAEDERASREQERARISRELAAAERHERDALNAADAEKLASIRDARGVVEERLLGRLVGLDGDVQALNELHMGAVALAGRIADRGGRVIEPRGLPKVMVEDASLSSVGLLLALARQRARFIRSA